MRVYHGTDCEVSVLETGSYVIRSLKDAWKFGYRKSVVNKRPTVLVYTADVNESTIEADTKRDRAFVLLAPLTVSLLTSSPTWSSPFKLETFKSLDKL